MGQYAHAVSGKITVARTFRFRGFPPSRQVPPAKCPIFKATQRETKGWAAVLPLNGRGFGPLGNPLFDTGGLP